MNSPFAIDPAKSLCAREEVKSAHDTAQCVRRIYLLLFQRLPDQAELSAGVSYLGSDREQAVDRPQSEWRYGFGGYDARSQRTTFFTPLAYFAENGYRVGAQFPDPSLGYLILNGAGGHPGHDGDHAAIRRWVAPSDLRVRVSGVVIHGQKEGDGVRARVISSRTGLLGEGIAHNNRAETKIAEISVHRGDWIDFALDPISSDGYDSFQWMPLVETVDGKYQWDSRKGFGPPADPAMTKVALYAQALMMTNEFMFVD